MFRILLAATALAGLTLAAQPVAAQAFTQAKGDGRVITSVTWSRSDKAFNDDADAVDINDYDQFNIFFIGEYGATDDLTLLLTPSFRNVSVRGASDTTGLGYTDVGARYSLVKNEKGVFSVQALARIPGSTRRDVLAQIGQTDMEYDLRAQGAVTFGQGSFVNLEGSYRFRAGDPPNETHLDATLGIRATPKLLLLANSFNTFSDGAGQGVFRRYRYHNIYASAAYDVSPRITLQAGVQGTVAGRNALRERGLVAGLWFRF